MIKILVSEIFSSIQGEGTYSGSPATFIRLFGCVPPYCDFCDSKYAWIDKENNSYKYSIKNIVKVVKSFKNDHIVLTGGEPFAQKDEIYDLINALVGVSNDVSLQIETSGKCKIDDSKILYAVNITMSPKIYNGKFKVYSSKTLMLADDYKFVIGSQEEMDLTQKFIKWNGLSRDKIYLMPKGATCKEQYANMIPVIEWCKEFQYTFSPRLHILIWDDKRGV